MSRNSSWDHVPAIILRIPGPWKSRAELSERLPADFRLAGDSLVLPTRQTLELDLLPADREFPRVFQIACRRPLRAVERRALSGYAMNVAVMGPAGSVDAAQCMLTAGSGIVRAGGIGVFIDNSLLAHSGSDWLELAENQHDPAAVFYSYINVARRGNEVLSYGMHVLGQRDGIVNEMDDLASLEDFLRMASADDPSLDEGEMFSDEKGHQFYLRGESDSGLFPNHPVNNPYGRWRLVPI